jgi:uncharacterized membrane protein HdeD (DUF308 family)
MTAEEKTVRRVEDIENEFIAEYASIVVTSTCFRPIGAALAVALFAGWLFLISGIVGLAGVFTAQRVPGFWWTLISALLAIAVGIYLIWRPLAGVLSLTLAVALFFGAQGISQIITAIGQRRALPSWGWVLVAGIANIVLAAIIWSGFPGTAEWVLGLLFGINLLLWGVALIMTALACRSVNNAPKARLAA